jgi:hypothetical protein
MLFLQRVEQSGAQGVRLFGRAAEFTAAAADDELRQTMAHARVEHNERPEDGRKTCGRSDPVPRA